MWLRIFHKAVKTVFLVFRRTICWKKQNSKTFFVSKFQDFFQSKHYFSTKLTNLLFKRWDEHFDEKMFFWKTLPQFCLRRRAKRFRQQNFSKLSKLNYTCSDEIFDEKTFFRKKFYSFFLLCSKTFLTSYNFFQSWQNCFSSGQTDTLVKKNFFWKTLPKVSFRFWAKHFSTFYTIFTKRLSKPFSTWSGNISRKQTLSFSLFSIHLRILGKSSHKFRIKFSKKWWKLHSTFSEEHFDEKRRFWKLVFFAILLKLFLSFDKIYPANCQNCLPSLQTDTLMKANVFQNFLLFDA